MIATTFYLHSFTSKEGKASIYIRVHADGLYEFRAAIHERIKRKHWNHKKQMVKADDDWSTEINQRIERIRHKVGATFREKLDEGQPLTIDDLKAIIRPLQKNTVPQKETISDVYQEWKKHYLEEKNLGNQGEGKGNNYTRRFVQVVGKLEAYQPGITLADITPEFLKQYRKHLIESGLQDTSIQMHYKSIRVLLAYRGLPTHFVLSPKAPKATKYDLRWEEVLKLYRATYSSQPVAHTALMFVMNCQVCLRYADLLRIGQSLMAEHSVRYGEVTAVNLSQGKTGERVFVPFPPLALSILESFKRKFPLPKANGSLNPHLFNMRLKQAAKEAGLNRVVLITTSHNGHIQEKRVPLHEVISSHAARHTGYSRVKEATKDKDLAEALLGHSEAGPYSHADPMTLVDALLEAWSLIECA